MSQIALPLTLSGSDEAGVIVVGSGNHRVADALAAPETWPFRTAVLMGPPRSGKTMLARWFERAGLGEAFLAEVEACGRRILENPLAYVLRARDVRRAPLRRFAHASW